MQARLGGVEFFCDLSNNSNDNRYFKLFNKWSRIHARHASIPCTSHPFVWHLQFPLASIKHQTTKMIQVYCINTFKVCWPWWPPKRSLSPLVSLAVGLFQWICLFLFYLVTVSIAYSAHGHLVIISLSPLISSPPHLVLSHVICLISSHPVSSCLVLPCVASSCLVSSRLVLSRLLSWLVASLVVSRLASHLSLHRVHWDMMKKPIHKQLNTCRSNRCNELKNCYERTFLWFCLVAIKAAGFFFLH